jgi:hypothetical protein
MAKQISVTLYTNRKGAERVGLQMSAADARALANGGDEAKPVHALLVAELAGLFAEADQAQKAS